MDPGSVLDQYTHELSNFPAELTFFLNELKEKDLEFYEHRKKIQQYDSQIHKFIKQNGSLANNPKEAQLYPKIRQNFDECEKIQKEKCKIANTSLFILTKHLIHLENDISKLEQDGLLLSIGDDGDSLFSLNNDVYLDDVSSLLTSESVGRGHANGHATKKGTTRKSSTARSSITPSASLRPSKRQKLEDGTGLERGGSAKLEDGDIKHKVKMENDSINDIDILGTANQALKKSGAAAGLGASGATLAGAASIAGAGAGANTGDVTPNNSNMPGKLGRGTPASTPTKGNIENGEDQTLYCFCRQVSFGEMIACDNSKCKYEWFHYKCVGLTAEPTGKWYCPDCAKKLEKKKRKKN